MAEKTAQQQETGPAQQQQVVSIRVSEELRLRLDILRQLIAIKTGRTVTTSEAARQLLESARDDRLELANLLSDPTAYLRLARHKADIGEPLTVGEWSMIAYYCMYGAEIHSETARTRISNESLIGLLQAFLAAYGLRKAKKTSEDAFYLSNLLPEERGETGEAREVGRDEVRRAVNQTIQALRKPNPRQVRPIQVARNLYHILDELEYPNVLKVNRELERYWPILWRVAARGHYFQHGKPLEEPRLIDHRIPPPPLPEFQEGECGLSLTRLQHDKLSLCLHLPGRLAPFLPISEFPAIAEFRAMLEEFNSSREDSYWKGYYFSAAATRPETGDLMISFRSEASGIAFTLNQSDWSAIRSMTRRAWEKSEVRRLWDQQGREYGEV
jgi:hypothetical protein